MNKGEFYKLNGYDFGWFVLEPLSKFVNGRDHELERGKSLSYGHKALYYWWYLDGQVTNGGFVQFYYNDYGRYIPTIIKGLELVGDTEMVSLVKKADKIYQKNKKLVTKAQKVDLFDSDLYDRLEELSDLDSKYYELKEKTMSLIEMYIRNNPKEICLDEEGKEYDMTYTGICKIYYEDKTVKEEFHLANGMIQGEFKSFFENGKLKEQIYFENGIRTGERKEYFDNEILKYHVTKDSSKNTLCHQWYHENGNPKKLESKHIEKKERFGAYKEWYENGQLAKSGTYISAHKREGEWLEFYQNGIKKVEAETVNGEYRLKNHWNEKGEQLLIEGTGTFIYESSHFKDTVNRSESEYENYKRHGKQKSYANGILTLYQEMENGQEHGYTRTYYKNGNLKTEKVYENGKYVSTKKFPKFQNPKVKTTAISRLCKKCYERHEHYELPDNEPMPLNDAELAAQFKADPSIFEAYGDDHKMSYGYYVFVDEFGLVEDIKFAVADNAWLDKEVKASMTQLKFEPAMLNGKPVKGIHYVRYQLVLVE